MKQTLLTILLTLLPLMASADAIEIDGIYYNLVSKIKEAEVTKKNNKYEGNIVIPETVNYEGVTYSVTSIGQFAFSDCTRLTSVTIGNNVTSIGYQAFWGCSVTSVTIGNNVTSIGEGAFEYCRSLNSVNISDVVAWCNIKFTDDGSNPLYNAHHLYLNGKEIIDLVIPNGITIVNSYAFIGCTNLTSVVIPNSVTSIGNTAFYGCTSLASVTIGNSVTSIGYWAFYRCSSLTSVTIPNSVTFIGERAFGDCSSLTSVTIPNSVTTIDSNVFSGCRSLTSVTIPNSVTKINIFTFERCI